MRFVLERVTQPAIEPVTLAEIIQHVREFSSASAATQTELTDLIVAGREWAESYTGRALIDQTWRLSIADYSIPWVVDAANCQCGSFVRAGDGSLLLYKSPALAITSFVSVDSAGTETDIEASTYALRDAASKWPRVVPLSGASWTAGPLKIEFRAGYADRLGSPQTGAEVVPARFKQAIKLWVEANFDRDKDMMPLLLDTARRLIDPEMADISLA